MKRELLAAGVGAIAAALLVLQLRPSPAPGPPEIRTDTLWMEAQRPQLEHPSLGQKLTTTRIRGQVAIADAPSAPAQLAVRRYCDPAVVDLAGLRNPVIADSAAPPAVLPDFGGKKAGPRLELFSTLNSATRWQWTGNVRGRVTWQSSGDTVLVTGDRLWIRMLRGTPKCGAWGIGGSAIGALAGQDLRQASLTGAITALACAF